MKIEQTNRSLPVLRSVANIIPTFHIAVFACRKTMDTLHRLLLRFHISTMRCQFCCATPHMFIPECRKQKTNQSAIH